MNDRPLSVLGSLAQALGGLPPAFLALCVVNIIGGAGLLWFLERQASSRNAVLSIILDNCTKALAR